MKSIYLSVVLVLISVQLSTQNNPAGYGSYPPPQPPPPPQYSQQYYPSELEQQQLRYQQQQQQMQQKQHQLQQRGPIPPPPYGVSPASRYPPEFDPYNRVPLPSQQQEGLLSKLKNSFLSAGSAIANTLDITPGANNNNADYYNSQLRSQQQQQPNYQRRPVGYDAVDEYGRYQQGRSSYPPQPEEQSGVMSSMFGKLKGWFGGSEESQQQQRRGPPPPSMGYSSRPYQQPSPSAPYGNVNVDSIASGAQPQQQQQSQGPSTDFYQSTPDSSRYQNNDWSTQQQPLRFPPTDQPRTSQPPQPSQSIAPATAPAAPVAAVDPLSLISPEPQIFIHEDNIVMILNPLEFYRKKFAMLRAGPSSLQLFSDFERVLTKAKQDNGDNTMSSMDILESSLLSSESLAKLKAIAETEYSELSAASYEDMTSKAQSVLIESNAVNIGSVAPTVKAGLNKLGLRPGWSSALSAVSSRGVPAYIFSSGYGDVVREALVQGGLTAASTAGSQQQTQQQSQQSSYGGSSGFGNNLPQNMRIISNYFRFDPTGNVKAFSQPIVHERNKNASTAAAHMGMPIPDRPYALVLGSHEDDVKMTDGLNNLKDQLSIGFMEVTSDLTDKLPTYLKAFDAVIIGEGSFAYVNSLVEELMHLPKKGAKDSSNAEGSGASRMINFRRFGGMWLNNNNNNSNKDGKQSVGSSGDFFLQ